MMCNHCKQELTVDAYDCKKDGSLKRVCRTCCNAIGVAAKAHREARPGRLYRGKDYASRNRILCELGFASYADYLASDLWKSIRRRVFSIKGSACFLCGERANQLHHNRYHRNDLLGVRLKYISPVCRDCHESIEFTGASKNTVLQARKAFRRTRQQQLAEK